MIFIFLEEIFVVWWSIVVEGFGVEFFFVIGELLLVIFGVFIIFWSRFFVVLIVSSKFGIFVEVFLVVGLVFFIVNFVFSGRYFRCVVIFVDEIIVVWGIVLGIFIVEGFINRCFFISEILGFRGIVDFLVGNSFFNDMFVF